MTKEQQYWEDVQKALDRIFDLCEEIDPKSGYRMIKDCQLVRGFVNKHRPQESEDEKVIRLKKGTLKARTGRYVIYDVEWLKEHFNTTEAKIYGQLSEDCISRKFMHDMGATTPQPKTGHWIYFKAVNTGEIIWSKCSECGNEERGCTQRMKYCPNCGAKMQEV